MAKLKILNNHEPSQDFLYDFNVLCLLSEDDLKKVFKVIEKCEIFPHEHEAVLDLFNKDPKMKEIENAASIVIYILQQLFSNKIEFSDIIDDMTKIQPDKQIISKLETFFKSASQLKTKIENYMANKKTINLVIPHWDFVDSAVDHRMVFDENDNILRSIHMIILRLRAVYGDKSDDIVIQGT